jgi:hypothetical protein
MTNTTLSFALILAASCFAAGATEIYNGNSYDFISVPDGISWTDAKAAAEAAGGHLATVTSAAENDFITAHFSDAFYAGAWLGGFQPDGSSGGPADNWHWVTGEAWDYVNWAIAEPNDWTGWGSTYNLWQYDGKEDALHFAWYSTFGTWNDTPKDLSLAFQSSGYVLEKEGNAVPDAGCTVGLLGLAWVALAGLRSRFLCR